MLPDIVVTDRESFPEARRRLRPDFTVSIGSPGSEPHAEFFAAGVSGLRLVFDDIEEEVRGSKRGPTHTDAVRIIQFAEGLRAGTGATLVHCTGGVSRSTATAAILSLVLLGGRGFERPAVEHLWEIRRRAVIRGFRDERILVKPNRRLLWLAGDALEIGGRLLAANEATFGAAYESPYHPGT